MKPGGRDRREGCEANEAKGSEGSTRQRGEEGLPWRSGGTALERGSGSARWRVRMVRGSERGTMGEKKRGDGVTDDGGGARQSGERGETLLPFLNHDRVISSTRHGTMMPKES